MRSKANLSFQLLTILGFCAFKNVLAQCPVIDFDINTEVCLNEQLAIINTSSSSEAFEWDFCGQDVDGTPEVANLFGLGANTILGLDYVTASANLNYAFVTSAGSNGGVFRVDFEGEISDEGQVIPLEISVPTPSGIVIFEEEGEWYGVLASTSGSIYRILFEDGLEDESPVIEEITGIANISGTRGLEILRDEGVIHILAAANRDLQILKFTEGINSTPEEEITRISGASLLDEISVFNDCGNWFALLTAFSGGTYHLSFPSGFLGTPTVNQIFGGSSGGSSLIFFEGDYYGFVTDTGSPGLIRLDFGPDLSNISPGVNNLGNLGVITRTIGMEVFRNNGDFGGIGVSTSGTLFEIDFSSICLMFSTEPEPKGISYTIPGEYTVTLYGKGLNSTERSVSRSITVRNQPVPDVEIVISNSRCISSLNSFSVINESNNIDSYSWDFNSDNIEDSDLENPEFQFSNTGEFSIRLDVEASNGCPNFITDTIQIFEEPIANFSISGATNCTNSPITFNNESDIFGADEIVEYEWDFNGEGSSTEENTSFIFTTPGMKTVNLTSSIPGCESFFSQSIEILSGPEVSFLANTICLGETTILTNNTSGGGITGFEWDFGNGTQSTLENPTITYQSPGTFNVKLSATNTDGCITTDSLLVIVNDVPSVDFSFDLACENADVQFFDETEVINSNIADRLWTFSENSGIANTQTSTLENPIVRFNQTGVFPVKLVTTSSFGCIDSTSISVNVFNSPDINFEIESLCLNDSTTFIDLSTIESPEVVTSRLWQVNGLSTSDSTLRTQIQGIGDFEASLTVSSSNFCVVDTTFQFSVAPLPIQNFIVDDNCNNEATEFMDLTTSASDPVISRTWVLDEFGISNDSIVGLQFPSSGDFSISLLSETENGCVEDSTFSITVFDAPEAEFSARTFTGGQPFMIDFINNTSNANTYFWDFDFEGQTSDEFEPSFTFEDLGNYVVQLVALNNENCSDTTFNIVSVVIPILEMELALANPVPGSNDERFILTLRNNGSILLDEIEVTVELNNGFTFREVVETELFPDGSLTNIPLGVEIPNSSEQGVEFICFEVNARNTGLEEENTFNNSQCIPLSGSTSIFTTFPNPAIDQLSIPVLVEEGTQIVITIISASGEITQEVFFNELERGLQNLSVDISTLNNGTYLMQVSDGVSVSTQRFQKN
ncbi:MAG: PKD domain-containing protein [Bacteroidota bacterium]